MCAWACVCVCVCVSWPVDGVTLEVGPGERNKLSFTKYVVPITNRSKDSYLDTIYQ